MSKLSEDVCPTVQCPIPWSAFKFTMARRTCDRATWLMFSCKYQVCKYAPIYICIVLWQCNNIDNTNGTWKDMKLCPSSLKGLTQLSIRFELR